jgi:hypothetical protein
MPYPDLVDQAVNIAGALGIRVASSPADED